MINERAALEVGPLPSLRAIILLGSATTSSSSSLKELENIPVLNYEELLHHEREEFAWRSDLDERTASSMCYTR